MTRRLPFIIGHTGFVPLPAPVPWRRVCVWVVLLALVGGAAGFFSWQWGWFL